MAGNAGAIRAGRAFVELFADDSKLVRGLKAASGKLKAWGSTVTGIGMKMMAGGAAMASPFVLAIAKASAMEETMNKFNVVFGQNAVAVKQWGDDFGSSVGRAKEQVASFMAGTQDLLIPLGFAAGAATDMSKQVTQLAVDLASFNNMADADVLRDMHAALTGSGEVMKKYGVIVSEAAVKQELLRQGMDPKVATDQQKVQARLNIIMAGTTAAQGDATRSAGSFANQMKALRAAVDDAAVEIGSALLPVVTPLVARTVEIATTIGDWIKGNQELIVTVAKITAGVLAAGAATVAFGTIVSSVGSILGGATVAAKAFGVALLFLAAHPMLAVFAAVAALTIAYGALTRATKQAEKSTADYYASQSAMRREDRLRFQELEKLAGQQSLTSDEFGRAKEILATLGARYGALGINIDAATGKISGMTEAQAKLNGVMQKLQINQVEMELRDVANALAKAEAHANEFAQRGLFTSDWTMKTAGAQDDAYTEVEKLGAQQRLLSQRMDILKGGGVVEEWHEAGANAGEAFAGGAVGAIDANQALLDQIVRLSIDSIEDPFIQKLAAITQQYEETMQRAAKAGQDVALVEAARAQAIDNAYAAEQRRQVLERQGEEDRRAAEEEELAERFEAEEAAIRRRIEDLELDLFVPGEHDRGQIQLNREFQRAMEGAQTEEAARLLNVEYQRRQELHDRQAAKQAFPGANRGDMAVGTMSKWALGGLGMGGGPAERTAKATEQTSQKMDKVIRQLQQQGAAVQLAVFS